MTTVRFLAMMASVYAVTALYRAVYCLCLIRDALDWGGR